MTVPLTLPSKIMHEHAVHRGFVLYPDLDGRMHIRFTGRLDMRMLENL